MKVRNGFVSNSSSSSFVIGLPQSTPMTAEYLMKVFKIDEESPIRDLLFEMCEAFTHVESVTEEEYLNDYGYESLEECSDDIKEIFNRGWKLYAGSFSDDSLNNAERMLSSVELDINTNEVIINSDGGY